MKEIIAHMIKLHCEANDGPLDAYLAATLDARLGIQKQRKRLARRRIEIEGQAADARRTLRRDEYVLEGHCRHWDITFHPDASGGNDSCYICNDCGCQANKIWRGRMLPDKDGGAKP